MLKATVFHSVVKLREVAKEHFILQEVAMGHLTVTASTNRTVTTFIPCIQYHPIWTYFYTIALLHHSNTEHMFKYRDNVNIDDQCLVAMGNLGLK